jgi:hypothetical protein
MKDVKYDNLKINIIDTQPFRAGQMIDFQELYEKINEMIVKQNQLVKIITGLKNDRSDETREMQKGDGPAE